MFSPLYRVRGGLMRSLILVPMLIFAAAAGHRSPLSKADLIGMPVVQRNWVEGCVQLLYATQVTYFVGWC